MPRKLTPRFHGGITTLSALYASAPVICRKGSTGVVVSQAPVVGPALRGVDQETGEALEFIYAHTDSKADMLWWRNHPKMVELMVEKARAEDGRDNP